MAGEPRKSRVAFAAFEDGHGLWSSIRKLIDSGIPMSCLAIAGPRRLLQQGAGREELDQEELLPLADTAGVGRLAERREAESAESDTPVLMGCGPCRALLAGEIGPHGCVGGLGATAISELRFELKRRLQQGAAVVVVSSPSMDQQWLSARILLEYSSVPVQTREYAALA